jgi:S-adenosylmethionine synthetase
MKRYLFTSESVSEGHPDKIADQISDAILDECLRNDPSSRVACETYTTTGLVLIGGEISTNTNINYSDIVRKVVQEIGYDREEYGFNYKTIEIINKIHTQSSDIYNGVFNREEQGAADQGLMFGLATNETEEYMPMPIFLANQILKKATELRKNKIIKWLRPDVKSQVTVEYEGNKPIRVDTIVLSHQHDEDIDNETIKKTLLEMVIEPVLKENNLLNDNIKYYINPSGRFVIGGPNGDAGLTGRKIIVDTYGGMGRHGGGAFSGKDPSKVDRAGAYMARYIAKNIVASELCDKCEIQIAYAIGISQPVSIMVDTFGTAKYKEEIIEKIIKKVFDCSPSGIIKTLQLLKPIYQKTASLGHFGRKNENEFFTWEKTDKVDEILNFLKEINKN